MGNIRNQKLQLTEVDAGANVPRKPLFSSYYLPSLSEQGKEKFLTTLHRYMEIHGTVYFETQRPPGVPAFVKNHGLLPQQELQQLLRKAKVRDTGARPSGGHS